LIQIIQIITKTLNGICSQHDLWELNFVASDHTVGWGTHSHIQPFLTAWAAGSLNTCLGLSRVWVAFVTNLEWGLIIQHMPPGRHFFSK